MKNCKIGIVIFIRKNSQIIFEKLNEPWTLTKIGASEILFVCWGFDGHIGKNPGGYERVHGGRGFERYNLEG